jgi:hypothetical protein
VVSSVDSVRHSIESSVRSCGLATNLHVQYQKSSVVRVGTPSFVFESLQFSIRLTPTLEMIYVLQVLYSTVQYGIVLEGGQRTPSRLRKQITAQLRTRSRGPRAGEVRAAGLTL